MIKHMQGLLQNILLSVLSVIASNCKCSEQKRNIKKET